jgi:hypothetical protein
MSKFEFKICIKTAGRGTRNSRAASINKALLPVGQKAAISRIIEKFPVEVPIVIALGHLSGQVRDFLALAHPERNFEFVEVDRIDGEGSGPGYSLLCCRPYLRCPFIFFACDTWVEEEIPAPDGNWIGVAPVTDSRPYLCAEVSGGRVIGFHDKVDRESLRSLTSNPQNVMENGFIGLAAIHDHELFWAGLENDSSTVRGELQVSRGLKTLIPRGVSARSFRWFDLGNDEGYTQADRHLSGEESMLKPDEFTYLQGERVIKFFAARERTAGRVRRAELLREVIPDFLGSAGSFYCYRYVNGLNMGEVVDSRLFAGFLDFAGASLWRRQILSPDEQYRFRSACRAFYYDKTWRRIESYLAQNDAGDKAHRINGVETPTIKSMFERIDWDRLCDGIPVLFHGDTQPENVIVADDGRFYLIDWREDFGGIEKTGDVYYDLAKIYHALIVSGEIIRKEEYLVSVGQESVSFNFRIKNNLLTFREILDDYLITKGYDLYKVKLLSALIYLNIAPLHHVPYSHLLYYLGKLMLHRLLEEK